MESSSSFRNAFDDYQDRALKMASYPNIGSNLVYPAMGLAGEAGECCDKIKKMWRNKGVMDCSKLSLQERMDIMREGGDVLWYLAAICRELDSELSTMASMNIHKLEDRHARGVIKSEGDNR